MEAVDFKLIDTAAITGQTSHKNACLQASFIIANSDKHEGMVKAWYRGAELPDHLGNASGHE